MFACSYSCSFTFLWRALRRLKIDKSLSYTIFIIVIFEKRPVTIGVASPYSFDLGTFGSNIRMYYNVGERLCFGPEYAFLKSDEKEVVDFDFVVHYIFETPWVGIYPVAGVNYSVEKELTEPETKANLGVVFGIGMHRNIRSFTTFVEYSRVELGVEDQFFTLGLMYNFR